MTPAELNACADGYMDQLRFERKRDQVNIYDLSAAVRAMIWGKQQPSFEELFPQPVEEMSDEAMYAAVRALNALLGGEEE